MKNQSETTQKNDTKSQKPYDVLLPKFNCGSGGGTLVSPMTLSGCGHSFSATFANQWRGGSCPLCRAPINKDNKFQSNTRVLNLLSKLKNPPDVTALLIETYQAYKNTPEEDRVTEDVRTYLLSLLSDDEVQKLFHDKKLILKNIPENFLTPRVFYLAVKEEPGNINVVSQQFSNLLSLLSDDEIQKLFHDKKLILKNIPEKFLTHRIFYLAVKEDPENINGVSEQFSANVELWKKFLGPLLNTKDEKYCGSRALIMAAIRSITTNGKSALFFASEKLKQDESLILEASQYRKGDLIGFISENQWRDDVFLKKLLAVTNRREVILAVMEHNGLLFSHINKKYKDDQEIILAAIKNNPEAILQIDKKIINTSEIWALILPLIYSDDVRYQESKSLIKAWIGTGMSLSSGESILLFIGPSLKRDQEIVSLALKQEPFKDFSIYPDIFQELLFTFNFDKEIISLIIKRLDSLPKYFEDEKFAASLINVDVISYALAKGYLQWEMINEDFKNPNFVLTLLLNYPETIKRVPDEILKGNPEFLQTLMTDTLYNQNHTILLRVMEIDGLMLQYISPPPLRFNSQQETAYKQLIALAVKNNPDAMQFVDPRFKKELTQKFGLSSVPQRYSLGQNMQKQSPMNDGTSPKEYKYPLPVKK